MIARGLIPLRNARLMAALALATLPLAFSSIGASAQQLPVPAGATSASSFDSRWTIKYDAQVNYFWSEQSNGISARQVQVPVGVALSGRPNDLWKIDVGLRGGYLDVTQSTPTSSTRFFGVTDTTVTSTVTYYGFDSFQPFVSFNASLPTGQTTVSANVKPDPDVFQTTSFGEGLNYGPTVGINLPLSQTTVVSLGVGHTVRGAFDRDGFGLIPQPGIPGSGPVAHVNPGDVTTANASIGYRSGPLALMLQGSYSWETTTTIDGMDFFKSGDRVMVAGAIGYAWTNELSSRFNASYTHIAKNETFLPPPPIPPSYGIEPSNSNNDIVNLSFDTTYKLNALSIGPTVAYMYRAENGYDSTMLQFVPAKRMWTLGATARYAVNSNLSATLRVARIWADVDAVPQKLDQFGLPLVGAPAVPAVTTDAWTVSFGATAQF